MLKIALRDHRTRAELTQEKLADLVGVRQAVISSIERGKTYPSIQMLVRIKRALNSTGYECSLDDLVEESDEDTKLVAKSA